MTRSGWSLMVIGGASVLWLASGVQRERPVLSLAASEALERLESRVAAQPTDAVALRNLSQAYIDARASGLAVSLIQHAPASMRADPRVDHAYARALFDQGRADAALTVERRVLDACAGPSTPGSGPIECDAWLVVSATRRAEILEELLQLGVEDTLAQPEMTAIAYQNATRDARLSVAQ